MKYDQFILMKRPDRFKFVVIRPLHSQPLFDSDALDGHRPISHLFLIAKIHELF